MFSSQYDRLLYDSNHPPKTRPLTLRLLSAIKESSLDEVDHYFSEAMRQTGYFTLAILDDFKDLAGFTLLDWAIMKWVDTPIEEHTEKQAARSVLDYLYHKISTVIIPRKLFHATPDYLKNRQQALLNRTPLDWAILCCQTNEIIGPLPQAPQLADIETDHDLYTPPDLFPHLEAAARAHNVTLISSLFHEYLTNRNNLPDTHFGYERLIRQFNEQLYSLFMIAAKRGYDHILSLLFQQLSSQLKRDAESVINELLIDKSKFKSSLLSLAVQYGHLKCAELLLKQGASINTFSEHNGRDSFPIHDAIFNSDREMISLLLLYNPKLNRALLTKDSPLAEMCGQVQKSTRRFFGYGYTLLPDDHLLHKAHYYLPSPLIREHRLSLVNLLLDNNAPLLANNSRFNRGKTHILDLVLLEASLTKQLNAPELTHGNTTLLSKQKKLIALILSLDLSHISVNEFVKKLTPYKKIFMADDEIATKIRTVIEKTYAVSSHKYRDDLANCFKLSHVAQQEKEFNKLVRRLSDMAVRLEPKSSSKVYADASKAALLLLHKLQLTGENFFANPDVESFKAFKASCKSIFASKEAQTLKEHRDIWFKIHPILRGIIGVLAVLAIIPALIVAATTKHGYSGTFFTTPETTSGQELNKLALKQAEGEAEIEAELAKFPR